MQHLDSHSSSGDISARLLPAPACQRQLAPISGGGGSSTSSLMASSSVVCKILVAAEALASRLLHGPILAECSIVFRGQQQVAGGSWIIL